MAAPEIAIQRFWFHSDGICKLKIWCTKFRQNLSFGCSILFV